MMHVFPQDIFSPLLKSFIDSLIMAPREELQGHKKVHPKGLKIYIQQCLVNSVGLTRPKHGTISPEIDQIFDKCEKNISFKDCKVFSNICNTKQICRDIGESPNFPPHFQQHCRSSEMNTIDRLIRNHLSNRKPIAICIWSFRMMPCPIWIRKYACSSSLIIYHLL